MKYIVRPVKNPTSGEIRYAAKLAPTTLVTLDQIAEEMALESTVTEHDIKCVLSSLQQHIISHLILGDNVRLGDLGAFRPSLRTNAAYKKEDFTTNNITKVNVLFTPSTRVKYKLSKSNPQVTFTNVTPEDTTADTGGKITG